MNDPTPAVRLMDLKRMYGDFAAVDSVSLDVRKGEFLTFLGSSGSGKTTTLNLIAGFDEATSGQILLNGRPVTGLPPQRRNIGMVFQRYTLFAHMSVADNVAFPLSVRKLPKAEIRERVSKALQLVQLERFTARRPNQLSGGQQQRVALARALVYEPQLLLMDEPLGALDKKLREEIQLEIRKLHDRLGVTILYVTHDQEEALRMSDRIAVFEHGRIVQVGSGEDLYDRPATPFVAGFVGNSNFLQGRIADRHGDRIAIKLAGESMLIVPRASIARDAQAVRIMVRPEEIELAPDRGTDASIAIPVTVGERIFLGDTVNYRASTADGEVLSIQQGRSRSHQQVLEVGAKVFAMITAERCHVFAAA
jgi:putative spermidine/putrescine transport system ATP-binding protein